MKTKFLKQLEKAHEQGLFASFIKDSASSGKLFKVIPALKNLNRVPQNPEYHPEGDVWTHTLLVIEYLPSNATFAMALSALFHDVGKAKATVVHKTGRISAHGHEEISRELANVILDDLGADIQLKEDVLFIVARHMLAHSKDVNVKTLRRLVQEGGNSLVDQLLLHGVADVKAGCNDFTDCIRLRELFNEITKQQQGL